MNTLSSLFFKLSPFIIFTVSGNSMKPTFYEGQKVLAARFLLSHRGDVVVVKDPRNGRLLLKRITDMKKGMIFVEGDNKVASTDSRQFGWIPRHLFVGKVIYPRF